MLKLAVFDLDGTLAGLGKPVEPAVVEKLRELEASGVRIAVCSGKPTYYLCGFLRQVGLNAPILVGENGAVIQFGVDLPPKEYRVLPYSEAARESIRLLRREFDKVLPQMWYQPNVTGLTPFPAEAEEFEIIAACVEANRHRIADVEVYRYVDAFDITPMGINKGSGIAYLAQWLGITAEETAAVGDGINDYPMFDWAGLALGVRVKEGSRVDRNFSTVEEAVTYLLQMRQM